MIIIRYSSIFVIPSRINLKCKKISQQLAGVLPLDINYILSRKDVPDDIKEIISNFSNIYQESLDKLSKSEIHYRTLVENSREIIFTTDREGIITSINSVAVKLTGWSIDEWIGVNFITRIHPDDLPGLFNGFEEVVKGIIPPTPEIRVLTKSGEYRVFEIKANPRIEDGRVSGVLGFAHYRQDFESQLIESEKIYRTLVENVNSGIFRVSKQGRLLQANLAFIQMFGFNSFEEFSSTALSTLYANTEDRKGFAEELYREGQINIKDVLMKTRDGINFWASISARVSPNGKWHDGIIEDISKRKYAEEAIKQVKLEEERYTAMLSHFLRNDLQKIVSHLELLSQKNEFDEGLTDNEVTDIIRIATRSSKTIDKVTLIFEVLQKPPISEMRITRSIGLSNLITTLIRNFDHSKRNFKVSPSSIKIIDGIYLPYAIHELIEFLINSNGDSEQSISPIIIEGHEFDQYYCLTIRDNVSIPIPERTCEILASKITERWESHGFYIGVTLASVIMQYLNGQLKIIPSSTKGNDFQLWIPNFLLKGK